MKETSAIGMEGEYILAQMSVQTSMRRIMVRYLNMKNKLPIEQRNLIIILGGRSYHMTPNGAGGIAYILIIKKEGEIMAEESKVKVDLGPVSKLASEVRKMAEESVDMLKGIMREKIFRNEPTVAKDENPDRAMPENVIENTAINLKLAQEALTYLTNEIYGNLSRELNKL